MNENFRQYDWVLEDQMSQHCLGDKTVKTNIVALCKHVDLAIKNEEMITRF